MYRTGDHLQSNTTGDVTDIRLSIEREKQEATSASPAASFEMKSQKHQRLLYENSPNKQEIPYIQNS
jgi:hypothetical protein